VSRIAAPPDGALPPAIRQIFADETREHGAPLNPTKVWARHPALFEAYRAFRTAMQQTSLVPLTLRYLVYVRVASLNGCPF
jgi:alkylhydroperoxidase family enzyme